MWLYFSIVEMVRGQLEEAQFRQWLQEQQAKVLARNDKTMEA